MTEDHPLFFVIAIPAQWYKLINSIETCGVDISSHSGSANQSNQLQSRILKMRQWLLLPTRLLFSSWDVTTAGYKKEW